MTDELGDYARVTFYPQQWEEYAGDEYAEPAADREPTSFHVPAEDATSDDGEPLEDDTYASDALREHENASSWVKDWDGPFYVTVDYGIDAAALDESAGVNGGDA